MNYSHYLDEYADVIKQNGLTVSEDIPDNLRKAVIECVSCDTREMSGPTLFVCKGAHFKEEFLLSALNKGAVAYVSEIKYNVDAPAIIVSDIRRSMAVLGDFHYDHASEKLISVGITGTKGKTTTAYFIKYILDGYLKDLSKPESAIISSIDTYDGVIKKESHMTTPEPLDVQMHFGNAYASGISHLVMEVTSQALKYGRVYGINYDIGCFLNIGYDHISNVEHSDFNDYFTSKLKLFDQCKTACVNMDSEYSGRVIEYIGKKARLLTFGTNAEADVYAYNIRKEGDDIVFGVRTEAFTREFMITMPGLFNVENALAAIAVCYSLGIPVKYIYRGLIKARASGRMEIYTSADNKITAIVDYAHNKMSFEALLLSVKKEFPDKRIILVFGCPGNKAFNRRKDLGSLAGRYSDHVIICEEDSGEEPFENISSDIARYVGMEKCPYSIIEDRGEAIREAILRYGENSVILITGKGDETRLKRGTEYQPCTTDVEYAKMYLDDYNSTIDLKALYYKLDKYRDKTLLIKFGGSSMTDEGVFGSMIESIAVLRKAGARVIIIHGGGPEITGMLKKLSIETAFVNGLRVTGKESVKIIEMVLSAGINKRIVGMLEAVHVPAVGISGRDGGLIKAVKNMPYGQDIGYVGSVEKVDTKVITALLDSGFVPVISPVSAGEDGTVYNVNADDAAYALSGALKADKFIFLTDVDGVLLDCENSKTLVRSLSRERAMELLEFGFIEGGMIPKLRGCLNAIEDGVKQVAILDGRIKYNLLLEGLMPKTNGTVITK